MRFKAFLMCLIVTCLDYTEYFTYQYTVVCGSSITFDFLTVGPVRVLHLNIIFLL